MSRPTPVSSRASTTGARAGGAGGDPADSSGNLRGASRIGRFDRVGQDRDQDGRRAPDPVAVAGLIAIATAERPPAAWLVPDPRRRVEPLAAHARIWVEHALEHGHVDTIINAAGLIAAAVWLHHDNPAAPVPPPWDYDDRLRLTCRTYAPRFHDLDAALDAHHPHGRRHHHLAFLAVHPGHRSNGYGTSLLTVHHDALDHDELPAFLHSSTRRAVELSRRHGYALLGDPHHLPGGGPPLWPMWRRPMPQRA